MRLMMQCEVSWVAQGEVIASRGSLTPTATCVMTGDAPVS